MKKKTLIPRPIYDVLQCSKIDTNCNVSVVSLEGIMSFPTKKKMTKCPQWLYEWLYSYNITFNPMWKINSHKWVAFVIDGW